MKKHYLLAAASAIALASAFSVNAATAAPTTAKVAVLQSCVSLLPKGHKFEFNMGGMIDTTDSKPMFDGGFMLTEGKDMNDKKLQKEVLPFLDCVKSKLTK